MNREICHRSVNRVLGALLACFVCLFILSLHVPLSSGAAVVSLPDSQHKSVDFIVYSKKQITIDAQGKTLGEVLRAVQMLSNIKFTASEELLEHKINKNVKAANWDKVVGKLLHGLNSVVFWDGDRMVHVSVLKSGSDEKANSRIFTRSYVEDKSSDMGMTENESERDIDIANIVPPIHEETGSDKEEYLRPPDVDELTGIPEEMLSELSEMDMNSLEDVDPSVVNGEIDPGGLPPPTLEGENVPPPK